MMINMGILYLIFAEESRAFFNFKHFFYTTALMFTKIRTYTEKRSPFFDKNTRVALPVAYA